MKQFSKWNMIHLRSNSELRDVVVVAHAEKHNKYQNKAPPKFKEPNIIKQRTAPVRGAKSPLVLDINHAASEPAVAKKSSSQSVEMTINIQTQSLELDKISIDNDEEMKKSASIRSAYSSVSAMDSECSFSEVLSDTESDFC